MAVSSTVLRAALPVAVAVAGLAAPAAASPAAASPAAASPAVVDSAPVCLEVATNLNRQRTMTTSACLQGVTLAADTVTHTGHPLVGFHGCAVVRFHSGQLVVAVREACFGVDGELIGRNHREDHWERTLAPQDAARVSHLTIEHFRR